MWYVALGKRGNRELGNHASMRGGKDYIARLSEHLKSNVLALVSRVLSADIQGFEAFRLRLKTQEAGEFAAPLATC